MYTVNVTGALWYIVETSEPDINRIRVYDFGYDSGTICRKTDETVVTPEHAIHAAKYGLAYVYVSPDTPKRSYTYTPDDTEFRTALSLMFIVGIAAFIAGRT